MTALIGAMLLLYVPLHTVYEGLLAPPIHDVTTDPEDPPLFVALAKRLTGANSVTFNGSATIRFRGETSTVSYMLHEYYSGLTKPLQPIIPTGNPDRENVLALFQHVKEMGWELVDYNEKPGPHRGQGRSFWFGQITDIVIRSAAGRHSGRALRHASADAETGDRDFGHNLELIKTYRATLNSEIAPPGSA